MKWLPVILLFSFCSMAQVKEQPSQRPKREASDEPSTRVDRQRSQVMDIFLKIEHGIQTNMIEEYQNELGLMVSITIGSGEHGYFSMNQAASVLAGCLSKRRPISFEFTRIHDKGPAPYATGRFVYVQKGNQEFAQVYVSLTKQNFRWVINQFNIY